MSAFGINLSRLSVRYAPTLLIEVMCVGVISALFSVWLMSSGTRQAAIWASRAMYGCMSFGKGGPFCPENPAVVDQFGQTSRAGHCENFGRAGRFCFSGPANEGDVLGSRGTRDMTGN